MPRSRNRFVEADGCYFLTWSVVGWLPLFKNPSLAQLVLDEIAHQQRTGKLTLHAYVLMVDHLHLICLGQRSQRYGAPNEKLYGPKNCRGT